MAGSDYRGSCEKASSCDPKSPSLRIVPPPDGQKGLTMAPHQERVVQEKRDLDEKLSKLCAFLGSDLFLTLPTEERNRLTRQHNAMIQYSQILGERIAAFPADECARLSAFSAKDLDRPEIRRLLVGVVQGTTSVDEVRGALGLPPLLREASA